MNNRDREAMTQRTLGLFFILAFGLTWGIAAFAHPLHGTGRGALRRTRLHESAVHPCRLLARLRRGLPRPVAPWPRGSRVLLPSSDPSAHACGMVAPPPAGHPWCLLSGCRDQGQPRRAVFLFALARRSSGARPRSLHRAHRGVRLAGPRLAPTPTPPHTLRGRHGTRRHLGCLAHPGLLPQRRAAKHLVVSCLLLRRSRALGDRHSDVQRGPRGASSSLSSSTSSATGRLGPTRSHGTPGSSFS